MSSGGADRARPGRPEDVPPSYLDSSSRPDLLAGGIRMIPVETPAGPFRVWTKRVGNNPRVKLLLLHGGPGFTHEAFEACDTRLPAAGVEYYYYDQLGSYYSDQPDRPELWELPRFVDEVEQVRRALGLGKESFFLLGQSWGGILALEYAFRYQEHLKGLVVSNMMSSVPAYNAYARDVLAPRMDPAALDEIRRLEEEGRTGEARYMELLGPHYYEEHVLRIPMDEWPEPLARSFRHMNPKVYVPMQGPSELGASGKLERWDRSADLGAIRVPTLVLGAAHDTMDPEHLRWMAGAVARGRYHHCPEGSHLAIYDDQERYFEGLISFLRDVDEGVF
ncbi:MAG TPA: proline iminopeptidase-family hydrolase [Thermoanaerobaculia bacterium]|nr:proline iminopeptidase-family hydrolase [Thermoanaerobaculia bacterium]